MKKINLPLPSTFCKTTKLSHFGVEGKYGLRQEGEEKGKEKKGQLESGKQATGWGVVTHSSSW